MQSRRRPPLVAGAICLACNLGDPGHAAEIDRVVGAVAPSGGAQLVKRFNVPAGSVIVGIDLVSNDPRTVFPRVALLQGAAHSTSEAIILCEVENVRPVLRHRARVIVPPIRVTGSHELYVAVSLPASNCVQAPGDGPALGATLLAEPDGSYLATSPGGELQPIDVDLAIDLVLQSIGKASPNGGTARGGTFLSAATSNPATSDVRISLGIERRMPVTLGVYTVAGRRVRLLADGIMQAGTYNRDWDRRDERGRVVAAGVYIARLETTDKVLTQKIVLIK